MDDTMSNLEREVWEALNAARQTPAAFADNLKPMLELFSGNTFTRPGSDPVETAEGVAAVEEAIAYLEGAAAKSELTTSTGLSLAARELARELASGAVGDGHATSGGDGPEDRANHYGAWDDACGEAIARGGDTGTRIVVLMIIDDGNAGRASRKHVFSGAYTRVGVSVEGSGSSSAAVCLFCGSYKEASEMVNVVPVPVDHRIGVDPDPAEAAATTATGEPVGETGLATVSTDGLHCRACAQTMDGKVVNGCGAKWHPACFKCTTCAVVLEASYNERDGRPYCTACFTNAFVERCHGCGEPLEGTVVKAMGVRWHKQCFCCGACGRTFDSDFVIADEHPFCNDTCAREGISATGAAAGRACNRCSQPLDGEVIRVKGLGFHKPCFVCAECGGDMGDEFRTHGTEVYCLPHFQEKFGEKCPGCQQYLGLSVVSAMNQRWHPECFVCAGCGASFTKSFSINDSKPYCNADCFPSA